MATVENLLVEQLRNVGGRALLPSNSTSELLNLLDEVEGVLSKVGQSPSPLIQEVLLLSMKALIADELLKSSDAEVRTSVAACLNEIMRISAPISPYEDEMMKQIFELIVSTFDNLSSLHGRSYSKAVVIVENVAKLRSCVMMLDLECDSLVTQMFEMFLKIVSPDLPHSVFLAMETIMNVMIKENDSESLELELVKVLLESIKNENQNKSPESWKLGSEVIEECSENLKQSIRKTVVSCGLSLDDYAPIVTLICKDEPDMDEYLSDDSSEEEGKSKRGTDKKAFLKGCDSGRNTTKKGQKLNSSDSCGRKDSFRSPNSHHKKKLTGSKNKRQENSVSDGVARKRVKQDGEVEPKKGHQASAKKGRPSKKDVSGGPGKKNTPSSSRKERPEANEASKSHKKRAFSDDDVETPFGKNYKEDLVGCRIKVWWPLDRRYYEGVVSKYYAATRKHKVDYDDGENENLNLRKERWEFVEDVVPAENGVPTDKESPKPHSNLQKDETPSSDEKASSETGSGENELHPDSAAKSDETSNEETNAREKSEMPETESEAKQSKLSESDDEQKA